MSEKKFLLEDDTSSIGSLVDLIKKQESYEEAEENDNTIAVKIETEVKEQLSERLENWQIKDIVRAHLASENYADAIFHLQDLIEHVNYDDVDFEAFCMNFDVHCKLHRIDGAKNCLKEFAKVAKKVGYSASYLWNMANMEHKKDNLLPAVMYYTIAFKAFADNTTRKIGDNLKSIKQCVKELYTLLVKIFGSLSTPTSEYIIELMREAYDCVDNIKDAPRHKQIMTKNGIFYYIGLCYSSMKNFEKVRHYNFEVCHALEEEYGEERASRYKVYVYCLHNVAVGLFNLGNLSNALKIYMRARDRHHFVLDWMNDEEKERFEILLLANINLVRDGLNMDKMTKKAIEEKPIEKTYYLIQYTQL